MHRVGIITMHTEKHCRPKEEPKNIGHMFVNYVLKTQNTTIHCSVNGEEITQIKQRKLIEKPTQGSQRDRKRNVIGILPRGYADVEKLERTNNLELAVFVVKKQGFIVKDLGGIGGESVISIQ